MRYELGLVNLGDRPLLELGARERVFVESAYIWRQRVSDLTRAAFRDPAAGWVAYGLAAPSVRILGVSDATPEEAAAARRAANV